MFSSFLSLFSYSDVRTDVANVVQNGFPLTMYLSKRFCFFADTLVCCSRSSDLSFCRRASFSSLETGWSCATLVSADSPAGFWRCLCFRRRGVYLGGILYHHSLCQRKKKQQRREMLATLLNCPRLVEKNQGGLILPRYLWGKRLTASDTNRLSIPCLRLT